MTALTLVFAFVSLGLSRFAKQPDNPDNPDAIRFHWADTMKQNFPNDFGEIVS